MPEHLIQPADTYQRATNYKYIRRSFFNAGLNNYVQAPAQDPDMFDVFENVLPSIDGTIRKRWGYALFNNPAATIRRMYEFQKDVPLERRLVLTSTTAVKALNEDGTTYNSSVFVPTSGAFAPRMVNSRGYGYFSDGIVGDLKKWDGSSSGGVTKWGIDPPTGGGGVVTASSGTLVSDSSSGGTIAWVNPGNAASSNDIYTDCALAAVGDNGHYLKATNFSFAIPSANAITGIEVKVEKKQSTTNTIRDWKVYLLKAGSIVGLNAADTTSVWPSTDTISTYGSSTNLWNEQWTPGDINDTGFGVVIAAQIPSASPPPGGGEGSGGCPIEGTELVPLTGELRSSSFENSHWVRIVLEDGTKLQATPDHPVYTDHGKTCLRDLKPGEEVITNHGLVKVVDIQKIEEPGRALRVSVPSGHLYKANGILSHNKMILTTAHIDHIQITVYHSAGIALGAKTAGNVTLSIGRKYFYVFRNSATGQNSGLSKVSGSTGVMTNQQQALSGITASTDSQVDRKILLATADGGDETKLYFLADLPNATTTYTDNTPELNLLAQNIYLETDEFGEERGVADNTPPSNSFFPTKHRGRLYMAAGQFLFFSKNRDELISSTGAITGRYEECWPADNVIDVSEGAETIRGLLSDGFNLYMGTERSIRRLTGDSPENFSKPEVLFNNVGLLNQDVWRIVYVEGSPVGAIWVTPDLRVMFSDFNTYKDIGTPVQTTLNSINTSAMNNSYAVFYGEKEQDWYMLAVPTGTNTNPDTILLLNLRDHKWHIWKSTDKVTSLLHNIDVNGNPQCLFGADSGKVYKFRSSDTQDRVSDTPVSFTTTIRTSWLDLGDPLLRKSLNWLEVVSADSGLVMTAQGSTDFATTNSVASAVTPTTGPFSELRYYLAGNPAKDRFYRFQFSSSVNTASSVLRFLAVEVAPMFSQ